MESNNHILIESIEIPDYPYKIKLSESRRVKYYEYEDRENLPKKYKNSNYEWNKGFLIDSKTKDKIISNPRSAGTPKYWSVNFQAIWNQQIKYQARANITAKLKSFFQPHISKISKITEFPIRIEMFLLDSQMGIDVDNKGVVYNKIITDLLTSNNIIPDDSSEYINDTGRCKWIKINEGEQSKMIIRIWKSDNSINL